MMTTHQQHAILLGVTGGVAAYKAAELARLFVKAGMEVQVVMSEAATRFVTPATFAALTGREVATDLWSNAAAMDHIHLSRDKDAIVVAPASADFIGKLAQGLADDLLSTLCLARERECPLILAPAMNQAMWQNPALQRNVALLMQDGVHLVGPESGSQACGEQGPGRMEEPARIFDALASFFGQGALQGQKVLVTAGPTFEAWDAVRGLGNLSSGRMGFAMAKAAREAGAEVCVIAGPVSVPTPMGVTRVDVISALEMQREVHQRLRGVSIFIAVAAVSDYRPAVSVAHKLKKAPGEQISLPLAANPDILAEVAAMPHPPFCVGFAAESKDLESHAEEKRRRKNVPLMVANLIADGLRGGDNRVILFDEQGAHPIPPGSKESLARHIIRHIVQLHHSSPPSPLAAP